MVNSSLYASSVFGLPKIQTQAVATALETAVAMGRNSAPTSLLPKAPYTPMRRMVPPAMMPVAAVLMMLLAVFPGVSMRSMVLFFGSRSRRRSRRS